MAAYHEGDWFAVPIGDEGYAVGLIARASSDGVLLGYFFGPLQPEMPKLEELANLAADNAILVRKFGHLALKQDKWPLLGRLDRWDRTLWPMPVFIRHEELSGRSFRVFYDENDPSRLSHEERVSSGESGMGPADGLMGAVFSERLLRRLLLG